MSGRFYNQLKSGTVPFIYLFIIVCAAAFAAYIFPIGDMFSGLTALVGLNAISGVISFAQWVVSDGMLKYTLLLIISIPVVFAALFSLLFTGALGSFASRAGRATDYPAMAGIGFFQGYRKRALGVFVLTYIILALTLLLALVWIIATIPLAVVYELSARGSASAAVFYLTLAVTILTVYIGTVFLRVYFTAFLPALFSDSPKPVASAFSFTGRNFFRLARYFFISDIIFTGILFIYSRFFNNMPALVLNCAITSMLIFFGLFAAFDEYAADIFGYE